jgi:hypothetical protein
MTIDGRFPTAAEAYSKASNISQAKLQEEKLKENRRKTEESVKYFKSQATAVEQCQLAVIISIAQGKFISQCGSVSLDPEHAKCFESMNYKVDVHAKKYREFRDFSGKNLIDFGVTHNPVANIKFP